MLDLKWIRQNPNLIRQAIELKNITLNLDELLTADRQTTELRRQLQLLEEQKNLIAKKVATAPSDPSELRFNLIQTNTKKNSK